MREQLALLPGYLTSHLELTLVALLLGIVVSVPLGVLVTRVPWLERPVLGLTGVIQTIPSLALLAFMVPALAAIHVTSIGYLPAVIGLWLYSMLPILQNTVTGIGGVDPSFIEAADGVGMTAGQRLRRVELPVALPFIVAGIRTATVWTVGIATLSTPVGAESLGNYIFSGLQTRNYSAVLVGCIAAAGLALLLDGLVRLFEAALRRRDRRLMRTAWLALVALFLCVGASFGRSLLRREGRPAIVVGAKTFTEQYILSELLAGLVRRETDSPTEVKQSLGSTVAFEALRSGEIDAYVDYSGTIWATVMHRSDVPRDRREVVREVTRYLNEEQGIVVAAALGFENTYAFALREAVAAQKNVRRLSDLARFSTSMSLGTDYEFLGRPEWRAVQTAYGLDFADKRSMDSSLMYQAVSGGDVDVITAFSTDGRILAYGLRVLEDDRSAIPPYDALVLVSGRMAREHPESLDALRRLGGAIDADAMRRLNQAVDDEGMTPATVAANWLSEHSSEELAKPTAR